MMFCDARASESDETLNCDRRRYTDVKSELEKKYYVRHWKTTHISIKLDGFYFSVMN